MEQGNAMTAFCFVEVGGGGEDRHTFRDQFIKDAPEIATRNGIDAGGRLIQQNYLGTVDKRADQAQFLLHAAGKLPCQTLSELSHSRGLQ